MADDVTNSSGDLLRTLSDDVRALIRQEVQQGQAEIADKARQAARASALLAGAGLLGTAAAGTSTVLLIRMLDRLMPPRAAAATATAVLAGAGAALAVRGVIELQPIRPLLPQQTLRRVDQQVQAARQDGTSHG